MKVPGTVINLLFITSKVTMRLPHTGWRCRRIPEPTKLCTLDTRRPNSYGADSGVKDLVILES